MIAQTLNSTSQAINTIAHTGLSPTKTAEATRNRNNQATHAKSQTNGRAQRATIPNQNHKHGNTTHAQQTTMQYTTLNTYLSMQQTNGTTTQLNTITTQKMFSKQHVMVYTYHHKSTYADRGTTHNG